MALTFSVPDTELSLSLHNRRNEVVDNVFQGTPFLMAMSRFGGVENYGGGLELIEPLLMSKNTTAGSFQNFDILDVTPQDNETSARYAPTGLYATVSIAWMQELANAGPGKLIDIVKQKTDDAMMSIRDRLEVDLLATPPAAGSKNLNTLTEIIAEDPSVDPARTTSIGSIGNANTWWRNKADSGGAFAVSDMNNIYNDVSDGSDFPTFMITGQTNFEYYENSQVGQIRYSDSRIADAGFRSLQFKDTPMLWAPQIGRSDEIYLINTKYLKLKIHSSGDFITEPFVTPTNQAAKTAKILFAGQLICNNRRRQGVLHGITAPA